MRALLFLVLASCTHDLAVFDRVDVPAARDLDLLFVLDTSTDHGAYAQMASQLDVLQARLADVDGQLPNLHVGVTTADLGTRGTLDTIPGPPVGNCAGTGNAGKLVTFKAAVAGRFLEDLRGPDGTRLRNFSSDDLALELGRLTNPELLPAATGCDFAQHLEAMRLALDPATNPGFVRPGAMLSVVFLGTKDDCSVAHSAMLDPSDASLGLPSSFRCTEQGVICDPDDPRRPGVKTNCRPRDGSPFMVDVSEYRTFLSHVKPDPGDVIVSAVGGPRTRFEVLDLGFPALAPSCQGPGGNAKPAVRLGALVDSFGGALVDGCSQDAAYQQITAPILARQRACVPDLRQADGDSCTVVELTGGAASELARCGNGGASPCWYSYADAAACPGGDHLAVAVRRGHTTAPAGSHIEATCFVN